MMKVVVKELSQDFMGKEVPLLSFKCPFPSMHYGDFREGGHRQCFCMGNQGPRSVPQDARRTGVLLAMGQKARAVPVGQQSEAG